MIEEITPNLYKIKIPLPDLPLKTLNSYLIKSHDRFLIIDTGMDREECAYEMTSCLRKLDVSLKNTDFFITHFHIDHLGLVARLATETSAVYFNEREALIVNQIVKKLKEPIEFFRSYGYPFELFRIGGYPEDELRRLIIQYHPILKYGLKTSMDFHILKEGDAIEVGDYYLKCIETPGHSPGHTCLYEPDERLLIAGDHLLLDIAPNVLMSSYHENPLSDYLASLDKVYSLDVDLVLPGHGPIFGDHRKRIRELKRHHEVRAEEILSILKRGKQTAYEIASQVSWHVDYRSWSDFPPQQKLLAVGETLAHLRYLEESVNREVVKDGIVMFSLKGLNGSRNPC